MFQEQLAMRIGRDSQLGLQSQHREFIHGAMARSELENSGGLDEVDDDCFVKSALGGLRRKQTYIRVGSR